jgi:hypothetical protein
MELPPFVKVGAPPVTAAHVQLLAELVQAAVRVVLPLKAIEGLFTVHEGTAVGAPVDAAVGVLHDTWRLPAGSMVMPPSMEVHVVWAAPVALLINVNWAACATPCIASTPHSAPTTVNALRKEWFFRFI